MKFALEKKHIMSAVLAAARMAICARWASGWLAVMRSNVLPSKACEVVSSSSVAARGTAKGEKAVSAASAALVENYCRRRIGWLSNDRSAPMA